MPDSGLTVRMMMAQFSQSSVRTLKRADKRLQDIFNELIPTFDCIIICSYRDKIGQDEAVAAGNSKVQWPNSKHNILPALAIDAAPYFKDEPHIRWDNKLAFAYMAGQVVAIGRKYGIIIRWGGDFDMDNNPTDWDWGHFEVKA
jgi:peptidoglycan L-alanyl-D-glutamate endopeptidase CwlK